MCPILFMLVGSLASVMTLGIIDKFELFKFMSAFSELELISIIQINFWAYADDVMIFTDIDEDFVLLASDVNGDFFKGMRNAKVELIFKIIIDGVLSDAAVELRHKSHIKVININNRGTAINYPLPNKTPNLLASWKSRFLWENDVNDDFV